MRLPAFTFFLFGAVFAVCWQGPARGQEMTAEQIMDKVLNSDNMGFNTGQARVKLVIQNKKGQVRVRAVESKSMEEGGLRSTLVTFIEPADVAGTRLLAREVKDGDDIQYLYLPALKEKRRIAGSEKNESFMGTDFTYNDLEQRSIEDSQYTKLPDEEHSGIPTYRIDAVPEGSDSEYSKAQLWVDKKDFIPLKIYFFDAKGEHYKTLVAQRVEPIDGKMTITKLMMKNLRKGSKTTMIMEDMDRGRTFPKSVFDESNLDK